MGEIVRSISENGRVIMTAIDSTDIVKRAQQIHKTSAVVTAGLGRMLTAASLIGNMLKGEKDSVTLRIDGGGPVGGIIAVSDSDGNVRGTVGNAAVELPLNSKGKLDVAGAVGQKGSLFVIKDLGLKEPYVGSVPIVSGEIAEDVTSYYAVSEQTPSVCALGVLVDTDLSPKAAGGFIIQLLPTADDSDTETVEKCISGLETVTNMIVRGVTPSRMCQQVLAPLNMQILDTAQAHYKCNCSKERFGAAIASIGREEIQKLADEGVNQEVICQFCDKKYYFSPEELKEMID